MVVLSHGAELLPKLVGYKLSRHKLGKVPLPIVLTYSVTNKCQSRCKTCNLWKLYLDKPKLAQKELKIDEIEKIFKSIGHTFFFNISGGEPYLRDDLPAIVGLACEYLTPKVIHTPTNGLSPEVIEKKTRDILEIMRKHDSNAPFTIKPSFDATGSKHDSIRGVKGNFEKVLDTVKRLKGLQKEFNNLQVGLGTVISKFNLDTIEETADYVKKMDVDSYINEIAEQRSELFTLGYPITPTPDEYEDAIRIFSDKIKKEMKGKKRLSRVTNAFRLVYYDLAVSIMREKRQILPCYAGYTNAHISPYGDVWPCCILGYDKSMGSLREFDYDFKKLWNSKQADQIRAYIKQKNCHCPMANVAYSNILLSPKKMMKVFKNMLF